jgi:hypothetical protein
VLFITHPVVPSIMLGLSDFLYHEGKPNVVLRHCIYLVIVRTSIVTVRHHSTEADL